MFVHSLLKKTTSQVTYMRDLINKSNNNNNNNNFISPPPQVKLILSE